MQLRGAQTDVLLSDTQYAVAAECHVWTPPTSSHSLIIIIKLLRDTDCIAKGFMVLFLLVVPHPAQSARRTAASTLWVWKQGHWGVKLPVRGHSAAELEFQLAELARWAPLLWANLLMWEPQRFTAVQIIPLGSRKEVGYIVGNLSFFFLLCEFWFWCQHLMNHTPVFRPVFPEFSLCRVPSFPSLSTWRSWS